MSSRGWCAVLTTALVLAAASVANAASLSVAWDPSQGAAGYVVSWGTTSGTYTSSVDIGNENRADFSNLTDGTVYYFVVQAYDAQKNLSVFSVEVSGAAGPDSNAFGLPVTPDQGSATGVATSAGTNVTVVVRYDVAVNFSTVTSSGVTRADVIANPQQSTSTSLVSPWQYTISTTAGYSGPVTIELAYDPSLVSQSGTVTMVGAQTVNVDPALRIVYGTVNSLPATVSLVNNVTPVTPPTSVVRTAATQFSDFNGDGRTDLTVYRPSTGGWIVNGAAPVAFGIAGDIPVPGDYNGDGTTEMAVFRPSDGVWYIKGVGNVLFGAAGAIPVPADYDGDGKTDIAVFRPSNGTWYIYGRSAIPFGRAGDVPVPGDYDGVGHAELAVYRLGTWYVLGNAAVTWGSPGDIPVPADYDGVGRTQIAVFRPAVGLWLVRNSITVPWGGLGDIPVPQDVDGDGRADLVIYTPASATWKTYSTANAATTTVVAGKEGDIPVLGARLRTTVSGDVDGDRRADVTVFRPTDATWRTLQSSTGTAAAPVTFGNIGDTPVTGDFLGAHTNQPTVFNGGTWKILNGPTLQWGIAGDVPVAADYDGDGITDIAVFRNGAWGVLLSSTNFTSGIGVNWGTTGDTPVPADYDGDGKADFAVFRRGTWFILLSSWNYGRYLGGVWGMEGDVPVPADYDGDGKADIAVYRNGVWYVLQTSANYSTGFAALWGTAGDVPMPGDYNGDGIADIAVFRPTTDVWYVAGQFAVPNGGPGDVAVKR